MVYNLSGLSSNTTGVVTFMQGVNSILMEGVFGMLIIIVIFVVSLIAFLGGTNSASKSFLGASFIAFSITILFRAVDLVPDLMLYAMLVILAGSVVTGLKD